MKIILTISFLFFAGLLFAQNSDSAKFYYNKGMEEKVAKHYLVASSYFNKSISFDPKSIDTYIENGRANVEMRKMDAAQGNFAKAYDLDNNNAVVIKELTTLYFNSHEFTKAIEMAKKCKDCDNAERVIAFSNYSLENYSDAIPALQKIIVKNPNDAEATYTLGKSYVEVDEYKTAIPLFQKAIILDTSHNSWVYELGLLYFNQNDYANAIKYFTAAAAAGFPTSTDYKENLGYAYLYSGNFDNGLKYLNEVLLVKPNSKEVLTEIAFAYYKKNNFDQALNYYQKIVDKNPGDAMSLYMTGMCYQKKGSDEKGRAICEKAIQMDPSLKKLKQQRPSSVGL